MGMIAWGGQAAEFKRYFSTKGFGHMNTSNTYAAVVLALGLVVASWILSTGLGELGRNVQRGAAEYKPSPVRIPDEIELNTRNLAPLVIRLESSSGGPPLKIEMSDKDG